MLFDIGLDPLGFGSLLFGKDLDFGIGRSDAALKERFLSPRVQLAGLESLGLLVNSQASNVVTARQGNSPYRHQRAIHQLAWFGDIAVD